MKIATWLKISLCAIFIALSLPDNVVKAARKSTLEQQQTFDVRSSVLAAAMKLDRQLQGKPVIVYIYATWCPGCKHIAPTMVKLRSQYRDKVHFVVLDVSDRQAIRSSTIVARKLGLTQFFNAHKNQTSTIAIIDPAAGRILRKFQNNANFEDYRTILDPVIAQVKP